VGYEPGDIFLLCTDGLVEGHYNDHLVALLRSPDSTDDSLNPAQRLVESSVAKDGRDNTTALVIEVVGN